MPGEASRRQPAASPREAGAAPAVPVTERPVRASASLGRGQAAVGPPFLPGTQLHSTQIHPEEKTVPWGEKEPWRPPASRPPAQASRSLSPALGKPRLPRASAVLSAKPKRGFSGPQGPFWFSQAVSSRLVALVGDPDLPPLACPWSCHWGLTPGPRESAGLLL